MEWILKSDNSDKMAKILALANKLGVSVVQMTDALKDEKPIPPKGKEVSVSELVEMFGQNPDFPTTEEIRAKTWSSKW